MVARASEQVARASYGKLVAILAKGSGDISAAEDALADAFAKALNTWSETKIPDNPEAWLITVARNRLTDQQRRLFKFPETNIIPEQSSQAENNEQENPFFKERQTIDDRLNLLFVCAHPAIAPDLHSPLMLQTVLGIQANEMARAFLASPAAMSQRLVRAKRKIKQTGISFKIPGPNEIPHRLSAVREAIYALHSMDWMAPRDKLGLEALYLADLLARLYPGDPENAGLAALIAFVHARQNARLKENTLIPVDQQNCKLWDQELISYGLKSLRKAQHLHKPNRFQLEAAIQSVHLNRQQSDNIDWEALNKLHYALMEIHPTLGGAIAQCVVVTELHGAEVGLDALEKITHAEKEKYQPFFATKAELLVKAQRFEEASDIYMKAIDLTTDVPSRNLLINKLNYCKKKLF